MRTLPLTYKIKRATKGLHGNVYKFPKKGAVLNQFGFNGQLKDNEIYSEGNAYAFEYRIQDPRLVRFLSVDPLRKDYPWYSPYLFAGNKTIWAKDLEGLEEWVFNENGITVYGIYPIVTVGEGHVPSADYIIQKQQDIRDALNNNPGVQMPFKDVTNEKLRHKLQNEAGGNINDDDIVTIKVQFNIYIVKGGDLESAHSMISGKNPNPMIYSKLYYGSVIAMGKEEDFSINSPAHFNYGDRTTYLNPKYFDPDKENSYINNLDLLPNAITNTISHEGMGHGMGLYGEEFHPNGNYPKKGIMSEVNIEVNTPTQREIDTIIQNVRQKE